MKVPFVKHVSLKRGEPLDSSAFPGVLPFTRDLHLEFDSPVTFFVGENGSGKSTLLEAIAVLGSGTIASRFTDGSEVLCLPNGPRANAGGFFPQGTMTVSFQRTEVVVTGPLVGNSPYLVHWSLAMS
jgi:ABC-type cobalamin/Fe3+-siderophores transport system ATPase subunit